MLNTGLDRKIFMGRSFLDVAAFLEEKTPFFARGESEKETQAWLPQARLGKKSVIHYLYAVIF